MFVKNKGNLFFFSTSLKYIKSIIKTGCNHLNSTYDIIINEKTISIIKVERGMKKSFKVKFLLKIAINIKNRDKKKTIPNERI